LSFVFRMSLKMRMLVFDEESERYFKVYIYLKCIHKLVGVGKLNYDADGSMYMNDPNLKLL
jgi:hypothetical protein